MTLRVAVADDSVLFREGVVRVLHDLDFEVVGQVGNGDDLLELIAADRPDVAVIDLKMPPTHTDEGIRTATAIRRRFETVGVALLSQYLDARYAMQLLGNDASRRGYLLKDRVSDIDDLAAALRTIADGGSYVDPLVVDALVQRNNERHGVKGMTEREMSILALMAQGRSNSGICERLHLSPRTVESHIRVIMQKLDLAQTHDDHRRVLAVLTYLQTQPAPPEVQG